MRLISTTIKNFRAYKVSTRILLADFTALVGKNDAGKSSVLDALEIFFNSPKGKPDAGDWNVTDTDGPIEITCEFSEFPDDLVLDDSAATTLEREHLLNERGFLEIKQIYSPTGKPRIFAIARHPSEANFDDLLSLTNPQLKRRASDLGVDLTGVDERVNGELRHAIWASNPELPRETREIELKKEATKTVWEKIQPHLPTFAIFRSDRPSTDQDSEAQDPLKAAIREAASDLENEVKEISDRVLAEVRLIAQKTVEKVHEISPELANQLNPEVSHKPIESLFSVSLTGENQIPINKRGSGTRRMILLGFFRARAEADSKSGSTIYAVEEPETSQHPSNQSLICESLEELCARGDTQVLITTHTPALSRRFPPSSVRIIESNNELGVQVSDGDDPDALKRITKSLGVLPDHNVRIFVGVEGKHDISFLRNISSTLSANEAGLANLEQAERDGRLIFVPCGGSNIGLWVARFASLNRPEFHLFDRDTPPPAPPHYQEQAQEIENLVENAHTVHTERKELENYVPRATLIRTFDGFESDCAPFDDVPQELAKFLYTPGPDDPQWDELIPKRRKSLISLAKRQLNNEAIAAATYQELNDWDGTDEVRSWLAHIQSKLDD